jgi:hypothetical protein
MTPTRTAPEASTVRPRSRLHGWLTLLGVAGGLTAAGMIWLTAAGTLSATGTRIANLESERVQLVERRSRALVAHAAATDPLHLESRARALGFGPPEAVSFLTVPAHLSHLRADAVLEDSPLGLLLAGGGVRVERLTARPPEPGGVVIATAANPSDGGPVAMAGAGGTH